MISGGASSSVMKRRFVCGYDAIGDDPAINRKTKRDASFQH
ncbi:MAG TPA: hypothetical protein VF791_06880 [Pyrinomonadaceae bacterium]